MRELRFRIKVVTVFLVFLLVILVGYASFSISTYGTRWFANGRNIRVNKDKENVVGGKIYDLNGVLLAYTDNQGQRKYQSDLDKRSAVVHLLGDSENQVANGVEKFQARYLYGFDVELGERVHQFILTGKRHGDDIKLTVDSELNNYIVSLFKITPNLIGKNGAVVVMNYQTGEVLSMVSIPVFDPQIIPKSAYTDNNNPFWNRATQSNLPPGSTFKIITLAAELRNNIEANSEIFNCTGALDMGRSVIKDYGEASHGEINLEKAFSVSCNNIFASLALKLGDNKLKETAEDFGFNDNFLFKDMVVENSVYPTKDRNDFELALTGIGQSELLATPMHMCMIASSIANNGIMMEPSLLKKVVGNNGTIRFENKSNIYRKVLDENIINIIKADMLKVVEKGTGTKANVHGMKIAGKTGSAEGMANGKPATHAWFVGFSNNKKTPYALCVMVEGGGSGGAVAAPLASKVFAYINSRYK